MDIFCSLSANQFTAECKNRACCFQFPPLPSPASALIRPERVDRGVRPQRARVSLSTGLRAGVALPERPRGWADRPRSTTREPATHRRREVTAEAGRMRSWRQKAELEDPSGGWAWNPLRLRTCQKTRQERPSGDLA